MRGENLFFFEAVILKPYKKFFIGNRGNKLSHLKYMKIDT